MQFSQQVKDIES